MAVPLIAALSSCGAGGVQSLLSKLKEALDSEAEPNGTASTATRISGSQARLRGNVVPNGDADLYSFTGRAGDRVYAATQTTASPVNFSDTVLDLLDRNGTTVLESDDNNGSLDAFASSIAGATLPAAGTYFIRVSATGASTQVRPYDLYFRLQNVPSTLEAEPNGTTATAQPFPAGGFVDGALTALSDDDYYSIALNAGDTLFLSLDTLPSRAAGSGTTARLGIGPFAGSMLIVDDVTSDIAPSEAMFVTVKAAGTYSIAVQLGGGALGAYRLSATVFPRDQAGSVCTTYSSTDVPKTIPADLGQVTSTIDVPGNPVVADLSVTLGLTHGNPPDIDVQLTAPGGNVVDLFTDLGSTTFQDIDVTLDEAAAFAVGSFTDMNDQVAQPEASYRLHWFNGQPAGGTWTLTVHDDALANGGTLNSWALQVCEPAAPICPDGRPPEPVVSFDFESGAGGFTHSGSSDSWDLGTPSAAPVTNCNGGSQCWKTNLAGSYPPNSDQDLVSAPIDLTGKHAPIQLSWAMKYQLESPTYDHAWIEIQNADGTNPTRLWEWRDSTMTDIVGNPLLNVDESAGWGTNTADVSAYAGRMVRLVFHLDASGFTNLAGLAVDDISVTHCPTLCDNGVIDPGEQCDNGPATGTAGDCCTAWTCQYAAASVTCRASAGMCDVAETCTGSSSACPADALAANGTACSDDNACTQADTCQGGTCTSGSALSCDDNDSCTTDTCDMATGCVHSGTCAPDAGGGTDGGADGGGGGGGGSCGCATPGGVVELAALQMVGVLWLAMRRARRKR